MLRARMIGSGLGFVLTASLAIAGNPVSNEEFKFTPNDGMDFDFFGAVTAIDNGIIAMGLPNDDDIVAENSGSVYLYDATNGAQLFKLNADVLHFGARFGTAVDIDNGIVAIGTQDDDNGLLSGSTYLFNTATGLQVFKLLPDDGESGDEFGISIALDSGIAAVGAWHDDDNGSDAGAVYVFDATTGTQLFKLLANDGAFGDGFGEKIAIDNGIVAIGARFDGDNGAVSGSVYLFDATTGSQLIKILPNDGASNDQFGNSVSMHDGILAVGAHQENASGSLSGSAYLFDVSTGDQIAKLVPTDGFSNDFFAESLAINNGTIVVGSPGDDDNGSSSGSGYVFVAPGANCLADLTGDGILDFFDVSAFLQAFGANDPIADFTNDSVWDFFDISAFLQAFAAGCQ